MEPDATSTFAAAGHTPHGATAGPDARGRAGLAAFASSMLAIIGSIAGAILVVLSVFVIVALTVHGRDLARSRSLDRAS